MPLSSGSRVRELRISLAELYTTVAISGCNVRQPGVVSSCKSCLVLLVNLAVRLDAAKHALRT